MKYIKKFFITILLIILISLSIIVIYFENYYHANNEVSEYISNNKNVKVSKISEGYFFDGFGEDKALIFYPGAKVETEAYSILMSKLAENGIDCFLIDMPLRFAFLGVNKASNILESYKYDDWSIAGHSLGGIAATSYICNNPNKINNIIYLASYPNKEMDINMLSIYGKNDNVLNNKSYTDSKKNWSNNSSEKIILGGNHANFGNYGKQKGDGESTISNEEQQNETVSYIVEFLNNN